MSSNWSEQQKAKTEVREKNKVRKEKLAGFIYDLAKLTFAALVLGSLSPVFGMHYEVKDVILPALGLLTTVSFCIFANNILK